MYTEKGLLGMHIYVWDAIAGLFSGLGWMAVGGIFFLFLFTDYDDVGRVIGGLEDSGGFWRDWTILEELGSYVDCGSCNWCFQISPNIILLPVLLCADDQATL